MINSIKKASHQISLLRRGFSLALAVVALAASGSALADKPAPTQISISEFRDYLPDHHPVVRGMVETADRIVSASDNGIKATRVAPVAESPGAILEALLSDSPMEGGPHLVVFPAIGLVDLIPGMELLNLPYLVNSYEDVDALLEGPLGAELQDRLEAKGLVALAWWENGFQQLYGKTKALTGPASFEGVTLRLMPDASYGPGFAEMGAEIVNPSFDAVPELLRTGAVDAVDTYLSQIYHTELYEEGGYLNLTSHSFSAMVVVMNKADWQGLDSETRTLLRQVVPEAAVWQREISRESEVAGIEKMRAAGVNVVNDIDRAGLASRLVSGVMESLAGYDQALQDLVRATGYGAEQSETE